MSMGCGVSDNNTAEKALAVVAAHLSAERPGLRRLFKGRVLFSGSGGMGGLRTAVGLVDGEDATGDGGGEGGWDVIQSDLTRRFTASRMRGRLYHPGGHPVSVAEAAALVALKGVSRAVRAGVAPWCDGKDAWHQTIFVEAGLFLRPERRGLQVPPRADDARPGYGLA
eukprot:CAMPEP_0177607664 /NCGR_PEP_ID=MMETSP0419_2-20121207/18042_1 /TAXON_ID=582737 /ORGANISM="Tetraselmis sp., Strain GSL018" /LENGTH=167 /DNA_ID=CAMNT_0019102269 /DNA_START=1788 /DNA_END=2287 /DNA_ORIENTATION=-